MKEDKLGLRIPGGGTISAQEREDDPRRVRESLSIVYDALNSSVSGVIIADLGGTIRYCNPAFLTLFEYGHAGELLGKNAADLFRDREIRRFDDVETVIDRAQGDTEEFVVERKDGSTLPVEVSSSTVKDEQGKPLGRMASFVDITARKQLEAERFQRRLEQERFTASRLESLGVLIGGIAHDFNNLLTGVLGNISLAMISQADAAGTVKCLEKAERSTLDAASLVRRLMELSKREFDTRMLTPASVSRLIDGAVQLALRGSSVRVEIFCSSELWSVEVDEEQIIQVLQALVMNAKEAMSGGGRLTVEAGNVEVSPEMCAGEPARQPGRYVKISIRDEGAGIPEEHLSRIFEPYFSTKRRGTERGMGLGLTSVFFAVKRHGGFVTVDTRVGSGTVFDVFLPAAEPQARTEQDATVPERAPERPKARVLWMDDEPAVREAGAAMLGELGYDVDLAAGGKEAIRLFREARGKEEPYDVLILDLTVRGEMGGEETMREIRRIEPRARGILTTGYSDSPVLKHFHDHGFTDAMAKPFRMGDLGRKLGKVLGQAPPDRE